LAHLERRGRFTGTFDRKFYVLEAVVVRRSKERQSGEEFVLANSNRISTREITCLNNYKEGEVVA